MNNNDPPNPYVIGVAVAIIVATVLAFFCQPPCPDMCDDGMQPDRSFGVCVCVPATP